MLPNRAFFPRIRRVKATFYPERSLSAALFRDDAAHERLRSWLPGGWVLRKRADALEMLRVSGMGHDTRWSTLRRMTINYRVETMGGTGLEPVTPSLSSSFGRRQIAANRGF